MKKVGRIDVAAPTGLPVDDPIPPGNRIVSVVLRGLEVRLESLSLVAMSLVCRRDEVPLDLALVVALLDMQNHNLHDQASLMPPLVHLFEDTSIPEAEATHVPRNVEEEDFRIVHSAIPCNQNLDPSEEDLLDLRRVVVDIFPLGHSQRDIHLAEEALPLDHPPCAVLTDQVEHLQTF